MGKRCKRDVLITKKLWEFQKKEGANVPEAVKRFEQHFAELCGRIKNNGFPIDIDLLDKKYSKMSAKRSELQTKIRQGFPPRAKIIAEVNPQRTKSGAFAKNTKGFSRLGDTASLVAGPFTLIEWEEFNIGSPKQVVERMDEAGWKPTVKTKSGKSWKVCEENLNTLPDTAPEEAKYIAEFLKLKTKLQLVENWYENYNKETGKVHGSIIHIGAITQRCAHRDPNTANIPGNDDAEWKIRECWGVNHLEDRDRVLLGADATGIQMRVLAHLLAKYTNDRSFMDACLHGDIHVDFTLPILREACPQSPLLLQTEKQIDGSATKWIKQNVTKRYNYAYVLGMGNEKAGILLGVDAALGKVSKEAFTNAFPGMPELNAELARYAQAGWAPAPDGRYFPIQSEFKALSVLLQGIESLVMKMAGLLWQRQVDKLGLDAHIVAFVHDEYQINTHKDCAHQVGKLMVDCIIKAGEMLKLRCPMDGEYVCVNKETGEFTKTWKETH